VLHLGRSDPKVIFPVAFLSHVIGKDLCRSITGEIGVQEALRAMIDREGPAYDLAVKRANKEFGVGAIGSMLGIPTKAYPTGEFLQRSLKDDFDRAYELYEQGNVEILRGFFDKHPEYETRLALFKTPEERLRNFIIDELWNTYNNFSDLNKREMREQIVKKFGDVIPFPKG